MSRQTDEQFNDPQLEAILSAAMSANKMPGDLAQRVFEQTADQLPQTSTEQLLDSAMAVDEPDGLADRVYEATRDDLPHRAVIGKIGLWGLNWPQWRTVAAAFLFGSSIAIFIMCGMIKHKADVLTDTRREIVAMSDYAGPQEQIDQEIDSLVMHVELAMSGGESWSDVSAELSDALIAIETDARFGTPGTPGSLGAPDASF